MSDNKMVQQANINVHTRVKFLGNPAYLRGLEGKVIKVSDMQPEVITVQFDNLKVVVTDIFQVENMEDTYEVR